MKVVKQGSIWGWQIVSNKHTKEKGEKVQTLLNERMLYLVKDLNKSEVTVYFAYHIPKKLLKYLNKLHKKNPSECWDYLRRDFEKTPKRREIAWFVLNHLTRDELLTLVNGETITKSGVTLNLTELFSQLKAS